MDTKGRVTMQDLISMNMAVSGDRNSDWKASRSAHEYRIAAADCIIRAIKLSDSAHSMWDGDFMAVEIESLKHYMTEAAQYYMNSIILTNIDIADGTTVLSENKPLSILHSVSIIGGTYLRTDHMANLIVDILTPKKDIYEAFDVIRALFSSCGMSPREFTARYLINMTSVFVESQNEFKSGAVNRSATSSVDDLVTGYLIGDISSLGQLSVKSWEKLYQMGN